MSASGTRRCWPSSTSMCSARTGSGPSCSDRPRRPRARPVQARPRPRHPAAAVRAGRLADHRAGRRAGAELAGVVPLGRPDVPALQPARRPEGPQPGRQPQGGPASRRRRRRRRHRHRRGHGRHRARHPPGRPGRGVPGQVPGGDRGPRLRAGAVRPHLFHRHPRPPDPDAGLVTALAPEIRALLDRMAASGRPPLERQSVAQARAFHVQDAAALGGELVPVAAVADRRIPGPAGELPVRVYTPEGEAPFPIVVFFHGGGWVVGTLDTYDLLCRALAAATPAVVVSVGYRLAPEHRWPAADAYAATLWASRNAAELGGAQHRLAVVGDSAGGNLAAVVALGARDRGGPAIAFQLLVYPVLDAAADTASWREYADGFYLTAAGMRWYWDHYLGGADGLAPDASPLRAAFAGGLPPALVVGASHDLLRDEGEAYAARLGEAGVDARAIRVPGMVHGFLRWRSVTPAADTALQEAAAALRSALAP